MYNLLETRIFQAVGAKLAQEFLGDFTGGAFDKHFVSMILLPMNSSCNLNLASFLLDNG
jgi:hypothetical protein